MLLLSFIIKLTTIALVINVSASGDGFLSGRRHSGSSLSEFRDAMGSVMGCGGEVEHEHLRLLEKDVMPMWQVLPKNQAGLVEWTMVRYLAHRYFMQKSSLLIRGFEPMRQISSSFMGVPQILETHVPLVVDAAIHSERAAPGYSLDEAVTMIATLEQLLRDDEAMRLEKVYGRLGISPTNAVDTSQLGNILETYMVFFLMDGDDETIDAMLVEPSLRFDSIPQWSAVRSFVDGLVMETQFKRHRFPKPGHALVAWSGLFSFTDAREMVSGITQTFGSYWEDECQDVKASLVARDIAGTGRLSLSNFYGANADGDWRFGESEAYLRDLGALDESSVLRGKQVIIPNYLQGASNCIVSTSHYLVCCQNECEAVLNEIEEVVGGPLANPDEILLLVGNMTNVGEEPSKLDVPLRKQLERIGETHGGKVSLHGRLFSQWLHYVFPHECQFPHQAGSRSTHTPFQYGGSFHVTDEEVAKHTTARSESVTFEDDLNEAQWMLQWSEEEELLADYASLWESPFNRRRQMFLVCGMMVMFLVSVVSVMRGSMSPTAESVKCDLASKTHCV
eukprot:TRINITY_DN1602_c0_g1_i1.p1 TRINITY_DN1602_c0_g1~~TRINITY_DN1602_c0_g1_i1.p1  ORF type:complete len:563 (-),score=89.49 TRINITY_DN1602_c0_g1_i1:261-1949(-)